MNAPALLASVPPPAPVAVPTGERCENCGNEVTQRYCGACGQRLEAPVHSLWHFSRVATEDLTHADSRLWRTLGALLFRPGKLTAEFLAGRRARYLPPLRLYLVVSVVFFLVAGATNKPLKVVQIDPDRIGNSRVLASTPRADETPQQRADRLCADTNYSGPWARTLQPLAQQSCRKAVIDNGRELQQAFLHNVPRAMFIFLPLLAGVMALLYWWPRHYYVEHLLLFVHNHAFVFLVAGALLLLGKFVPRVPGVNLAVFLYFAWYMYRSMRVVYRQGRLLTVSKLVLLAFCYLLFAALMIAATSAYSVLML
jgi:uncharacterized protein DUF3667